MTDTNKKFVVVLGASSNHERYSFMAVKLLSEKGYPVIPVHPSGAEVNGLKTFRTLDELNPGTIGTISIYVNPSITEQLVESILRLRPERLIFNPGTEDARLSELFTAKGIEVEQACTLVLLKTDSF